MLLYSFLRNDNSDDNDDDGVFTGNINTYIHSLNNKLIKLVLFLFFSSPLTFDSFYVVVFKNLKFKYNQRIKNILVKY